MTGQHWQAATGRPDVSIIIVSYNTSELIRRCLTELYASLTPQVTAEVVVVDNASGDVSADAIATHFPQVRLVRLTTNVGFGRGVNRGAMVSSGRYLLCLNPDTLPVGHPVTELVTFADQHPGHGLYTGRTLHPDGTDDNYSCWGMPSLWSVFGFASGLSTAFRGRAWADPEGLPDYDRRSVREVPALSGCILLIERELFGRLGGFDPQYFLYSEDIDLSARARELGARPLLTPTAQVVHLVGASSSSDGQRIRLLRGKATYLRRHWSPLRARIAVGMLAAGVGLRAIGKTVLGRDRSRGVDWVGVWRARADWAAGYPPVDEERPTTERLQRTAG
ncbi:glycosyltransferase family 2 protein [Micromonospora sp. LOL_023]|uniref:glycosyltransferase family 2 protein n=1 Tax=Micromonospora sp. LOL_023 TaxID=3345418 RepID=UPI003A8A29AF